jgi:hypothetical protein
MIECIFVVQICCYSKCGVVLEELNPHLPLAFWLSSPLFSTSLQIWFGLPHPSIACILWCMCTHPINATNFHLLCCAHGNERTSTHDVVHDTFVAIAWDANFNVGQEQLHPFFFNNVPFLLSTSWCCVHQKWNLHLNRCCHCQSNMSGFISLILCNQKIYCF